MLEVLFIPLSPLHPHPKLYYFAGNDHHMAGSMFKPHEHVSSMPSLQLGAPLHHESHDNTPSYPQHKFSPHFAAAVSAAAAAVSSSHKSAFVPTSHQLSLYRYFQLVNIYVTTL